MGLRLDTIHREVIYRLYVVSSMADSHVRGICWRRLTSPAWPPAPSPTPAGLPSPGSPRTPEGRGYGNYRVVIIPIDRQSSLYLRERPYGAAPRMQPYVDRHRQGGGYLHGVRGPEGLLQILPAGVSALMSMIQYREVRECTTEGWVSRDASGVVCAQHTAT